MNTMEYKGYIGSVDFSEEDQVLHGKVLGIRSLVSYEGTSVKSLIKDFHHSVDLYLENCKESGTKPETAYKGSFNVRIPSDMHKKAAMDCPTGADIKIELRDPEEIKTMWYKESMALPDVKCYNPAFDVTDHSLLTAIVTDKGIVYPPFEENLKKLFSK